MTDVTMTGGEALTCPVCGAPLAVTNAGKCRTCGATLAVTAAQTTGDAAQRTLIPATERRHRDLGGDAVLEVEDLRTYFFTNDGTVRAVDGVNFAVRRGETLGIVGESGCGKSITSLSIMQLISRPGRVVAGRILFNGRNLLEIPEKEMEEVRGNDIAMIFQEPMTALNPVYRVGDQVAEVLIRHEGIPEDEARARTIELFEKVRIPAARQRIRDYPHQLSGGMRQRVMIAMALACKPKLLVADEPTTALDVTIQAQILALIDELKHSEQMAVILITHDLGVIAEVADHVAVMYAGKVVEEAPVNELFANPQHPYTRGLLSSIPSHDKLGQRLSVIKGVVPHPLNLPPGCPFAPRCPSYLGPLCDSAKPALMQTGPTHLAACYLHGDEYEPEVARPRPEIVAKAAEGEVPA